MEPGRRGLRTTSVSAAEFREILSFCGSRLRVRSLRFASLQLSSPTLTAFDRTSHDENEMQQFVASWMIRSKAVNVGLDNCRLAKRKDRTRNRDPQKLKISRNSAALTEVVRNPRRPGSISCPVRTRYAIRRPKGTSSIANQAAHTPSKPFG